MDTGTRRPDSSALPRSWETYPANVRENVRTRELACVFERDGGKELATADALGRFATLSSFEGSRRQQARDARAKLDQFVASLPERRPPTPEELAAFEDRHAAHDREMKRRVAHLRGYVRRSQARKVLSAPTVLPAPRRAVRGCQRARGAGRPRAVARASSRGGDSGDDSSGSEPPGETTGRPLLLVADPTWGRVNPAMLRTLRELAR